MQYDLHIHMILDGVDFRKAIGTHRSINTLLIPS